MSDNFYPNWPPSQINAELNHKASEAASVGDLGWYDSTNHCARSAGQFADQGNAAATQTAFALVFAGVFNSKQLGTDATARNARLLIDAVFDYPCASDTYAIGDYVGVGYSSGPVAQKVQKVNDASLAIGRVVKEYTSATTNVKCRLTSQILAGVIQS